MTQLEKEITENGIHYTFHGDYYFPDLKLPETPRQTIGRFGRMRKAYLEKHHPALMSGSSFLENCTNTWRKSTPAALIGWTA